MTRMTPETLFDRLQEVGALLEESYDAMTINLRRSNPDVDPLTVVTLNGDPVVAPVLAALGQVYSGMAHLYLSGEVERAEPTQDPPAAGIVRHYATSPFVRLCGEPDEPESLTEFTSDTSRVTCPRCVELRRVELLAARADSQ